MVDGMVVKMVLLRAPGLDQVMGTDLVDLMVDSMALKLVLMKAGYC